MCVLLDFGDCSFITAEVLNSFVPVTPASVITTGLSSFLFLKSTEQVAAFCRSLHEMNPSDSSAHPQEFTGPQLATMRQLTDADKLRKVICELLETERTYVKVGDFDMLFQSANVSPSGKPC